MPFSNPVVAGDTLIPNAIQSEGFVTGVTGWEIARDGSAEFNDVDVRGTLTVSAANGTLEVNVNLLGQPQIIFTAPNGDSYTLEADNTSFDIGYTGLSGRASMHIVDGEGIAFRSTATGAPSVLFDDTDGLLKRGSYSPWTENGWTNVALQNLWVTTGVAAFDDPSYRMDITGRVWLRGAANGGTKGDGTLLFTLPVGHRPASLKQLKVSGDVAGTTPVIQVETDGEVRIYQMGASNAWVLDEVSFSVV